MPHWRAANYLSVGQIYLYDNPLLKGSAGPGGCEAHAARPLGHDPRAEFHLRALEPGHQEIRSGYDLRLRPGARRPCSSWAIPTWRGLTARSIPNISQDQAGLRKLFIQFSFPGGIPSHASAECPGSIHEGGELGYSLSHSFGAVFDNRSHRRLRRRRWRGGNRTPGHRVAFQQVPRSSDRRRGAANPAPQRL